MGILDLGLLPSRCGACGRAGSSPCLACRPGLRPAPVLVVPASLATLSALLAYDGPASRLVLGIKCRHERSAVAWLAGGMALLLPQGVDLVTWAPTSHRRAARRGVDHARLLAEAVGTSAGVRTVGALRRTGGPAQHGRSRADRLSGGPAFVSRYGLDGLSVAVVDDVTTTGATLAAAGEALVAAGAAAVHGLTAAAVPTSPFGPISAD